MEQDTKENLISPAAETVLTFLDSLGRRSESELYLRLFRQLPKQSFAVIAAEAAVLQRGLDSFVEQLRFLSELKLFTPVVLGLLDPESAARNLDRLLKRGAQLGLEPRVHQFGDPGLIGHLEAELTAERVPIVTFPAAPSRSPPERFAELGALAAGLETRKLVILRRRGALAPLREQPVELGPGHVLRTTGDGISIINLRSDADLLLKRRLLRKPDAALLERVAELLRGLPKAPPLVSVTSPLNLLRELFTVKGAGTLIKPGSPIERRGDYGTVQLDRLQALLEASFGRPVLPSFFERPPAAIFIERNYRGAAIVEPSPIAPFLSKFAVDPVAQGEGIGQDLWQELTREYNHLFWRTRAQNPISSWYAQVCDGMLRLPHWHVFWRGVSSGDIPAVVQLASSRPTDFATVG